MPIAAFCDKILVPHYLGKAKKNSSKLYHARRLIAFLRQSSANSTADLATSLIYEFLGTCGDISESYRIAALCHFRRICNLAVERGCLRRNPFEEYPLPKTPSRSFARVPKGRKLDASQIRSILEYLKAGIGTWKGHRLYVFTSVIVYAGLQTSEALQLTLSDCDLALGLIRVPRRTKLSWSMHAPVVQVPPKLTEILTDWFPRRMHGKPDWATQVRYGTRLADDGRTLVPDKAEQRILAEMRCWRSEGWSLKRIARELDSRAIPTKLGRAKKWSHASVDVILKREFQPDPNVGTTTNTQAREEGEGLKADPGWVFPIISGKGHWSRTDSPGYTALDQLREAGKALGIEGLTFESLRRFYLENTRPTLDLGWDDQVPRTESELTTLNSPSVTKTGRADPVPWRGTREQLGREIDAIESEATRDVVRKLIDLMPDRPTKHALEMASGRGDAVNHLKRLAASGSRLGKAIGLPGKGRPGYWVEIVIHDANP